MTESRASSYHGASQGRNFEDWDAPDGSADALNEREYELLRARARDRERNDAHAQAIVQTMCDNVVGTGIRPQAEASAEALGVSEAVAEEWNNGCERAWKRATRFLDATGRLNVYQMQQQIFCRAYVDGDLFLNRVSLSDPNRPLATSFELVEAERVSSPPRRHRGNRVIREGVELGNRHEPMAYWVTRGHPRDASPAPNRHRREYLRIRSKDRATGLPLFMHVYKPSRPQQTRGVTALAPALKLFKYLDDYLEAELVGKRMEACIGLIREVDPMSQLAELMSGNDPKVKADERITKFRPGMEARLFPGETLQVLDPKRPGQTFDPFVTRMLLAIGASVSVPYLILLKDYNRTSYSSYRGALKDFLRHCETWHELLVSQVCQPMWEAVVFEAWAAGELPAVDLLGPNRQEWLQTNWLGQKRDWVDPSSDAKAEETGLANRTKTHAEIQGGRGRDWKDHLRQSIVEEAFIKAERERHGLDPLPPAGSSPVGGDEPEPDPAPDDDEFTDEEDDELEGADELELAEVAA